MKLIVGLGNPGQQYKKTRHNIGFMVLDQLSQNFKFNKKLEADLAMENKVIFAKPQTFMNESGRAVAKIVAYYNIPKKNIYIIHDDKDLNFGSLRIRISGSAAGHNGIKSIIEHLQTQDFIRFRLGVKNPIIEKQGTTDFVLSNFSKLEQSELKHIFIVIAEAIETAITQNIETAMNQFNKKK